MKKRLRPLFPQTRVHGNNSILPESAFLVLSILFGIAFVFITPPFQVPDEDAHFFRSYQLSEGGPVAGEIGKGEDGTSVLGGILPESVRMTAEKAKGDITYNRDVKVDIRENITSLIIVPLDPRVTSFVPFPNSSRYPFASYIPQAVAILFGRIIGLSPLLLLYLGRVVNLAAWILLVYASIRVLPAGKWVLFLAALTPMSLFMGASVSGDAATNGLCFLFIALVMRYGLDDNARLTFRGLALISALAVLIALCRTPYFLIVFLFLIVPFNAMGSRVRYWAFFGSLVAAVVVINIGWQLMTDPAIAVTNDADVSVHGQIRFILADPLNYVVVMARTFWREKYFLFLSYFGILGWLDTYVSFRLAFVYAPVLFVTAAVDGNEGVTMKPLQRVTICGVILIAAAAIFTALYATWTPVGAPAILGLQGRYFIAFSPLFYLIVTNRLIRRTVRVRTGQHEEPVVCVLSGLVSLFAIGTLAVAIWKLVVRFYL